MLGDRERKITVAMNDKNMFNCFNLYFVVGKIRLYLTHGYTFDKLAWKTNEANCLT